MNVECVFQDQVKKVIMVQLVHLEDLDLEEKKVNVEKKDQKVLLEKEGNQEKEDLKYITLNQTKNVPNWIMNGNRLIKREYLFNLKV